MRVPPIFRLSFLQEQELVLHGGAFILNAMLFYCLNVLAASIYFREPFCGSPGKFFGHVNLVGLSQVQNDFAARFQDGGAHLKERTVDVEVFLLLLVQENGLGAFVVVRFPTA